MKKILTLNMMQFGGFFKMGRVRQFLKEREPDIVLFQEGSGILFFDSIKFIAWRLGYHVETVRMHPPKWWGAFCNWRLGILSRSKIFFMKEQELGVYDADNWRRSVLGCLLEDGIGVFSVHLGMPGPSQLEQVNRLLEFVRRSCALYGIERIIIGGDFNAPDPGSDSIKAMLNAGFIDLWAEVGMGDGATFPKSGKRIDYFFLKGLQPVNAKVVLQGASDHHGLYGEVLWS